MKIKKYWRGVQALTLTALFAVPVYAVDLVSYEQKFSDVTERDIDVVFLAEKGVILGNPDGTVKKEAPLNRAEALTIFARAFQIEPGYDPTCTFSDVKADDWFAPYVSAMCKNGFVTGYPDGTFKPGNQLNKAEALALLYRMAQGAEGFSDMSGYDLPMDVPAGAWYEPYATFALERNLTELAAGKFGADMPYLRGDLFTNLYRYLVTVESYGYVYSRDYDPRVAVTEEERAMVKKLNELKLQPANEILRTELQMLMRKTGLTVTIPYSPIFSDSSLMTEANGGFGAGSSGSNLDFLTGEAAIDENLQLGSVGRDQSYLFYEDPTVLTDTNLYNPKDLVPVDIKSHPWDQMLAGKTFSVPKMATLVPKDSLFAYTKSADKFMDLEEVLDLGVKYLNVDLYSLADMSAVKERMLADLEINVATIDWMKIGQFGLIAEDFEFAKGNEYAFVFEDLGGGVNLNEVNNVATIAGFQVVASSEALLNRIKSASQDQSKALANEKDFHYALAVLEQKNDGMVYISDAFVRKMVGPDFRILARRRNSVVQALESLQYATFAYRKITASWPDSIEQMAKEGYIRNGAVYEEDKYQIGLDGVVSHSEWGNLWDLNPVTAMKLSEVTAAEKFLYERFVTEYQTYFREFFDPIAVAVTVGDQIKVNTVVLPLIHNTTYASLRQVVGMVNDQPLGMLSNPGRVGIANMGMKFSFDEFLLSLAGYYRDLSGLSDEEKEYPYNKEILDLQKMSKNDAILFIEKEFVDEIGMEMPVNGRVLDFFGDEVTFGMEKFVNDSDEQKFFEDLDVWMGVKIKDSSKAQSFVDLIVAVLVKEEPSLKFENTQYQGVKYVKVTTDEVPGLVVTYFFRDGWFYVGSSMKTVEAVIGGTDKSFANFARALKYIGTEHDFAVSLDAAVFADILTASFADENLLSNYQVERMFDQRLAHWQEASTVAKLISTDGDINAAKLYYRHLPEEFFGGEFVFNGGVKFRAVSGVLLDAALIDGSRAGSSQSVVDFVDLVTVNDAAKVLKKFGAVIFGLNFDEAGLEVNMVFGNPNSAVLDSRF